MVMDESERYRVRDFMTREVISLEEDAPIEDVIQLMVEKNFNAFPVVRGRKLVGIVSKMDLIKVYTHGKLSEVRKVRDVMRKAVLTLSPNDPLEYAANLMVDYRIRSLPVTDQESNLIGILAIGDILKAILERREH
jgi:CBS domain-containing protein